MDLMTAMIASKLAGLTPSGGGGGGGVTDYNKLDNKPCSVEKGTTEILPETTVEIDPEIGEGAISDVVDVQVGKSYVVKWNGVEYICTAQAFSPEEDVTFAVLGNLGTGTGGTSTGEPFILLFFDAEIAAGMGAGGSISALDGSQTVTLSIYDTVVHQLANIYLPRLVVNFTKVNDNTDGNATADKSYAEIAEAFAKGLYTEGRYNNDNAAFVLHFQGMLAKTFVFGATTPVVATYASVREDGTVTVSNA